VDVLVGRVYKHFKGNYYIVLNIALNTETNEKMVIYKALYGDGDVYARPYDSFVEKISNGNQERRFELQNIKSAVNYTEKEKIMKQLTYIMVKPEFAEKNEVIELVKKEAREAGMEILREKFVMYSVELAQKHYAEHFRGSYENAKGFYKGLENYITSGRAYGMVMEGENSIETMRAVIKRLRTVVPPVSDDPEVNMTKNVLHGSDCEESAEKEIAIFDSMDAYVG
jgi:nucleoside-diphosphate kinase